MFDGVTPEMTIAREEIFGPVLAAIEFADVDEAIARANDSIYGLAAAVWTSDIKKAHYVARKLQAGTVWINTYNVYDTAAPFGGYKQSGFGREMSAARARALHAGEERVGGSESVSATGVRQSSVVSRQSSVVSLQSSVLSRKSQSAVSVGSHRPVNFGLRFSRNAVVPSSLSSEL